MTDEPAARGSEGGARTRSDVLAVTTRSRLRGLRHFPLMFVASLRIRRQLRRTPGCVRFASIIAGPREFWTITVWQTRDKMLDFMRSGAHEDIMWLFGKWLSSFWLTRWRPSTEERGAWKGLELCQRPVEAEEAKAITPEAQARLEAALEAVPNLRAAAAPHGAPSYDHSPYARRRRQAVAGGVGVMMRIEVPHVWQVPRGWRDLKTLRRSLRQHPDVLRWATGISRPRELYGLAVLRNEAICSEFLSQPEHGGIAGRWGNAYWTMRWQADNEFGHWDGLRLRKERLGSAIPVPERAARAARVPAAFRSIKK